ncbi:Imm41 family immunity protein [Pasteurellaceae bacterium LIM206]|nr:Imm41 family immunity protein [Pasteurellaceae bacterium LIM206]
MVSDLYDFYRNVTYFKDYDENSFIGKWLDYSEWDDDEYFKLEEALLKISEIYMENGYVSKEILLGIMRILDLLMIPDWTIFEIKNDILDIYCRYERFKYLISVIFCGEKVIMPEFEYSLTSIVQIKNK